MLLIVGRFFNIWAIREALVLPDVLILEGKNLDMKMLCDLFAI